MAWFDLSHPIDEQTPVYPGDPTPRLDKIMEYEPDGYVAYYFQSGMHAGTHIDAPLHLDPDGQGIDTIPLERLAGQAVLLDVRGQNVIRISPKQRQKVNSGDIVLFYTGWDQYYGSSGYYSEHPVLDETVVDFLVKKQVGLIGLDTPSPDRPPFRVHEALLRHEILIIENLTRLEELLQLDMFEIIAMPLKIRAEASLTRVVARELRSAVQ